MKAKVYFTRTISPEKVVELYRALGVELPGKVAVKVHSGEKGNQNFLHPEFWKPMVEAVQGTIVECNTAYGDAAGGVRDNTDSHWKLMEEHGWTRYFDVDIMDAEGPDVVWPIPGGKVLKENHLGKNIENYDSMLVLAHFKGHPMGGLRRGAQAAGHRLRLPRGQGADPLGRRHRRPVQDLGTARQPGPVPRSDGRCGPQRRRAFQGQDRLHQCDEEPLGGLRLLRRGRGPLHEGHRHPCLAGPGGHRPGLHRPGHAVGTTRARNILWSGSTAATASIPSRRRPSWAPAAGNMS